MRTSWARFATLLLPFVSAAVPAAAEPMFTAPFIGYLVGGSVSAIAAADMNRDGRVDLVAGTSGSVQVLIARPDGTFTPQAGYSMLAPGMDVGDLNRDGRQDVVTAGSTGVSVRLGNGDGSLGARTDLAVPGGPVAVAIGDWNGDLIPDLSVAAISGNAVVLLRGQGDGTFVSHATLVVGTSPVDVVMADFSGDGWLDIATANRNGGGASFLKSTGSGTFAAAVNLPTAFGPGDITAAFVDADVHLDLVVSNELSDTVSVLRGNGNGTFAAPQHAASGPVPVDVVAADWNQDGRTDLLLATLFDIVEQGGSVSLLLGNGDGTFAPRTRILSEVEPNAVVAEDWDGDLKLDFAAGSRASNLVAVHFGNGSGAFGTNVPVGAFAPSTLALADLDGDLLSDLMSATMWDLGIPPSPGFDVEVRIATGGGNFSAPNFHFVGNGPAAIETADLDADDDLDMVIPLIGSIKTSGTDVAILLGDGAGGFGPTTTFPVGSRPNAVVIGRVDAGDALDLVFTCWETTPKLLISNGDGTFQAPSDITVASDVTSVAMADLDHDNDLDLVFGDNGPSIEVLLGNGNGTFGAPSVLSIAGAGYDGVAIGDLNSDGDLDVVASGAVLLGNGDGSFQAALASIATASGMVLGDVDADGRLDVVTWAWYRNTVAVYLGHDDGTFWVRRDFGAGNEPLDAAIADVDGDTRLDIAVAGHSSHQIQVLLNRITPPVDVLPALSRRPALWLEPVAIPGRGSAAKFRFAYDAAPAPAVLDVHDVRGRLLWRDVLGVLQPGQHDRTWNRRDPAGVPASRGVYIVNLVAGPHTTTRKLILAR